MPSSQFNYPEEPNEHNIVQVLDSTYTRFQSVEQARWNESNIDVKFWAGDQEYVYTYFQFAPNYGWKKFFYNIIQQPCNMVTGYQRQHRKSYSAIPVENSDQYTADQLNKILPYINQKNHLLERFSEACEQSLVTGMVLIQPYLDYSEDMVNGDIKLKIWEYNSFLIDPYFRDPAMSDCNFIWCQKYISKKEALLQFPEHRDLIQGMSGYSTREGRFYFLPENYNIARNDLLVLSHYWFKTTRTKQMVFNHDTGETSDFMDTPEAMKEFVKVFPNMEIIEREVPTWKIATVLNRTPLYVGLNPLGYDCAPMVPVIWNYDPYIPEYNLRVRSLIRSLRDAQFLFNRRILLNHDISESSLNSGWMYEEDSVVNEENFKYAGQGKDIIVKTGTATWPTKIIPNSVPPSDMELANQMMDLIPRLSGVNQELLGMSQEEGLAGITQLLRQGAGLVTLQKYFDQWDRSLELLGHLNMLIVMNKWMPFKIQRIIGEQPTEQFYSKNFQKFGIQVAESLDTAVQRQQEFAQLLEFQKVTGIQIPPELLLKNSTLQGKEELIQALSQSQQMQQAMQQEQQQLELSVLQSKLENLKADSAEKLALARERTGRTKSNVGLFEERVSEVSYNTARAIKEKISAIKELLDTLNIYGNLETLQGAQQIQSLEDSTQIKQKIDESEGKKDAGEELSRAGLNNFLG